MIHFNYQTKIKENNFDSKKLDEFKKIINDERYGFFHFSDNKETLKEAKNLFEKYKDKTYFIQVGIGGSSLGPMALIHALKKSKREFIFLDNIDSDYIFDELNKIKNHKDALFYIVSKSGGTAETTATLMILMNWLKDLGVREDEFKNYFVFCTDKDSGDLRKLCSEKNYDSLYVPKNIGGRFSVQTHVGLFPALFAGIKIDELFDGMNDFKENLLNPNLELNPLIKTAHIIFNLLKEYEVNETILMPYSSKLRTLSFWFVQLWGESLGKINKKGENVGLTPIPAYGATDQHSQMQLFMEGPKNKLLFMLDINEPQNNFKLESNLNLSSVEKLKTHTLNDLMKAEFHGTLNALLENEINFIHLNLNKLNEKNLGSLILFFESLTALMGIYLAIDPFNQPGVEKGKIYAYEYLNSLKLKPKSSSNV